jgi:hypothetical protein
MNQETAMPADHPPATRPQPWWCFGIAWLAFGLPASAVVASTLSAVIAIRHADPVVDEHRVSARQAADEAVDHATEPAEFARNHASLRH